jgi:hypothetical protein
VGGLAPGGYAVVVQSPGYLRRRLPVLDLDPGRPPEPLVVTLERSMRVTGRIVDSGGVPVGGARVLVDDAQRLSSTLFESFLDLNLPSLVAAGPGILGVGELGVTLGPVPPIPIEARPPSGPGPLEALAAPGDHGREEQAASVTGATSGSDGSFLVDGIAPGEVRLVVVHPSYATLRSDPLLVPATDGLDGVELVLEPGGTIGGTVLDSAGRPVPSALVWMEGASALLAHPVPVGPDGSYRADHVHGDIRISVTCPGYFPASRLVTLASGESSLAVDIVLVPEGERVTARVLDPWAFPVEGALVVVSAARDGESVSRSARSDADGVVSFPSLPGSSWTVVASHPVLRTLRTVMDAWEPPEEPTIEMGFAAGLGGTVIDGWSHLPVEGFTVTVLADGQRVARRACTGGSFAITDLPPGDCTVRVEAEGYATLERDVTLPRGSGPGEVTLPDLVFWIDPLDPGA